jgi:hypothetical protein
MIILFSNYFYSLKSKKLNLLEIFKNIKKNEDNYSKLFDFFNFLMTIQL